MSKVLRHKEKYLPKQADIAQSPERRGKRKSPDIERTLSNWAIKEQKRGTILSDDLIRDKAQCFSSVSGPDHAGPNPANNPAWLKNFKRTHNISGSRGSNGDVSNTPKKVRRRQSSGDAVSLSSQTETSPSFKKLRDVRSEESLNLESADDPIDHTITLSTKSIRAGFVDTSISSFSPDSLLSPTSPFFSPEPNSAVVGSFFRGSEMSAVPSSPMCGFQRPRSQTFPMIFHDHNTNDNLSDGSTLLPSNALDASMDDIGLPLGSIDEAMIDSPGSQTTSDIDRPRITTPQTMQPPPLPLSAMAARKDSASLSATKDQRRGSAPSQAEARQALQVVWQYFSRQSRGGEEGMLNMEETVMMGRFMEKLSNRG